MEQDSCIAQTCIHPGTSVLPPRERNRHRFGIVKSAKVDRITISPHGRVTNKGYLDKKLSIHSVIAVPQATEKSSIGKNFANLIFTNTLKLC
jgi:hypothetical protein